MSTALRSQVLLLGRTDRENYFSVSQGLRCDCRLQLRVARGLEAGKRRAGQLVFGFPWEAAAFYGFPGFPGGSRALFRFVGVFCRVCLGLL